MITLLGAWEHGWLEPKVELFMWRQLCAAYQVDRLVMCPVRLEPRTSVDQYPTIEEALDSTHGARVFLEPKGVHDLKTYPHPKDAVYIFGKAGSNNLRHAETNETVRIQTPHHADLFAIQAAAITLFSRFTL